MPVYASTRLGTTLKGKTTKSDYLYELTDHLGNVRAILKDDYAGDNVLFSYADYYPGGFEMPGRQKGSSYRFGYQGQFAEKDEETGFNQFEAREYDPRIMRWMVTDPAGQYWSSYESMGNEWTNTMDPTGEWGGERRSFIENFRANDPTLSGKADRANWRAYKNISSTTLRSYVWGADGNLFTKFSILDGSLTRI